MPSPAANALSRHRRKKDLKIDDRRQNRGIGPAAKAMVVVTVMGRYFSAVKLQIMLPNSYAAEMVA